MRLNQLQDTFRTCLPVLKWRKFWGLSAAERTVFVQSLLILPALALGLCGLGLRRLQALLARSGRPDEVRPLEPPVSQTQYAQGLARVVRAAAANGPYRATCLPQSLAVWWLLGRRGMASELRIGVRKEANRFEAHAWVEYEGTVLNDQGDVPHRFAPFAQIDARLEVSSQ